MDNEFNQLKLDNQLCFPLYACSKAVVRQYKQYLDPLDLTYTQYITMMAMWENRQSTVKELGELLFLDSGTLTPVLKKLESKGYIKRCRSKEDERNLCITLTEEGDNLKYKAKDIPEKMSGCIHLPKEEAAILYKLLHKIMEDVQ